MNLPDANGWMLIECEPKDGTIIWISGSDGPYGITRWEGLAYWGVPKNSHPDSATWLAPRDGADLSLAGYAPSHWRHLVMHEEMAA